MQISSGTKWVYGVDLVSFAPVTPAIYGVQGCLSSTWQTDLPFVGGAALECHPGDNIIISGANFTSSNLTVELLGYGLYNTTAPGWVLDGRQLYVRAPSSILSVDENVNMSIRVTAGGRRSALYTNGLSMANTLTLASAHGCLNDTGNATGLCVANQTVTIRGTGFTPTTTQLAVNGRQYSPPCLYLNSSAALCTLPDAATTNDLPVPVGVHAGTASSYPLMSNLIQSAHRTASSTSTAWGRQSSHHRVHQCSIAHRAVRHDV